MNQNPWFLKVLALHGTERQRGNQFELVSGRRELATGDVLEIGKVKAALSFQD